MGADAAGPRGALGLFSPPLLSASRRTVFHCLFGPLDLPAAAVGRGGLLERSIVLLEVLFYLADGGGLLLPPAAALAVLLVFGDMVDEAGEVRFFLGPVGEEGPEVLEFAGGVVVADGFDLAEVELEQAVASEVLVYPAEALPFEVELLEVGY